MSDFITSVHVEPRGGYDHVSVFVRSQCVGTLIADRGDGARIRAVLLGAVESERLLTEARQLLDLGAAELRRSARRADWLTTDFHALYLATERLVAHLDLEAEFDLAELNDVKTQLHRMLPAFEECEAARVLAKRTKEGT
jgi:hypothetical protein